MTVIAEIGTSHNGSLEKAKQLIDAAKEAGADCVKFQWVYAEEILHPDTGLVKLPTGDIPLYRRFQELECSQEFYAQCLEYAHNQQMLFACSPFGLRSLKELVEIKPDAIKIASPEVNHIPLLAETSNFFRKVPIILSSGVSTLGDIEKAIGILTQKAPDPDCQNQEGIEVHGGKFIEPLTLLHCITSYPAPEEEYNVRCVSTLHHIFGIPTGISDHSLDPVLVPVLTTMFGGTMIEKHITLSKETDGLDDPVALNPEQFSLMVHSVHQTEALINRYRNDFEAGRGNVIGTKKSFADNALFDSTIQTQITKQLQEAYDPSKITAVIGSGKKFLAKSETSNYGRTNRSLHYMKSLVEGHVVTNEDVSVLRTEKILSPGISPDFLQTVIGKKLTRSVHDGDGVQLEDFMC